MKHPVGHAEQISAKSGLDRQLGALRIYIDTAQIWLKSLDGGNKSHYPSDQDGLFLRHLLLC